MESTGSSDEIPMEIVVHRGTEDRSANIKKMDFLLRYISPFHIRYRILVACFPRFHMIFILKSDSIQ